MFMPDGHIPESDRPDPLVASDEVDSGLLCEMDLLSLRGNGIGTLYQLILRQSTHHSERLERPDPHCLFAETSLPRSSHLQLLQKLRRQIFVPHRGGHSCGPPFDEEFYRQRFLLLTMTEDTRLRLYFSPQVVSRRASRSTKCPIPTMVHPCSFRLFSTIDNLIF